MPISQALDKIEHSLQDLNLWQNASPTTEQLNSEQPFALDTLEPTQWLQWVFLPKMRALIALNQPLPTGFEITPYFEQALSDERQKQILLPVLKHLDLSVK